MSEKRFKLDFDNCSDGSIMDRKDKYGQYCRLYDFGEIGRQQIVDLLNSLNEENEQLRKQIQNYKQLIANSYEGEEERLDGFFGKYVIWEDELQKMIK